MSNLHISHTSPIVNLKSFKIVITKNKVTVINTFSLFPLNFEFLLFALCHSKNGFTVSHQSLHVSPVALRQNPYSSQNYRIFFKPSEPDSSSNATDDPTSRARSTIRGHAPILRSTLRNPSSRATNRPRIHRTRRRAPTDDVEQHRLYYSSDPTRVFITAPTRSSITTTTSDAMGHARRNDSSSPEIPIITFRPSVFTDFVNANDDDYDDDEEDEDDGLPMPAVPESRDFSNPSNIESRDSVRRHQRLMRTAILGAHGLPLASILSRTSPIPEQRSRAVSPTRIDVRNTNRNVS